MKRRYRLSTGFLFIALLLLIGACSKKSDELILNGEDANILTCSASTGSANFESSAIGDSITILVPDYVDTYNLNVKVKISEFAKIQPLPEEIRDWSAPVKFTVTAEKGNSKEYVIAVVQITNSKEFNSTIRLGSQAELDNFFESGYTAVDGIVLYNGNSSDPIKDLSAMDNLTVVKGDIYIQGINAREIRLESLTKVGNIFIDSPSATRISMPNLKFIAERFQVGNDLSGTIPVPHKDMEEVNLPSLEYVGGTFKLFLCSKLESLESLSKLKHIGKDLIIEGGLFENLKGLENIKNIDGRVFLNGEMTSLEGFAIENVGSSVTLFLEYVTDLTALKSLKHVGLGITLQNNTDLKDLSGLENIQTPNIEIKNFLSLETLNGLYGAASLEYLTLSGMPKLKDIRALSKLESVKNLSLGYMPELESLNGLQALKTVTGQFRITLMAKLTGLSGLSNLTTVGTLSLSKMDVLTDITALKGVKEMESLYLENLLALTDLNGLQNLTKITQGGLSVLACPKLTDLSPLANISEINFYAQADRLKFELNPVLSDYTPVSALIKKYMNANRVYIKNNLYNPTIQDITDEKYSGTGGTGMGSIR